MDPTKLTVIRNSILRGLGALSRFTQEPGNLDRIGHDVLFCLANIYATDGDPENAAMAAEIGTRIACCWLNAHAYIRPGRIGNLVLGALAARDLGFNTDQLRAALIKATQHKEPEVFLLFNPFREPPPGNLPAPCAICGARNRPGTALCGRCGSQLSFLSPFLIWYRALVTAWAGEQYGIQLGAPWAHVAACASQMRPYPENTADSLAMYDAATHLIYTATSYGRESLSPGEFPDEFGILKRNIARLLEGEPFIAAEFADCLRLFHSEEVGLLIDPVRTRLLSLQRDDGGWGDYHATWAAIDALRDRACNTATGTPSRLHAR